MKMNRLILLKDFYCSLTVGFILNKIWNIFLMERFLFKNILKVIFLAKM